MMRDDWTRRVTTKIKRTGQNQEPQRKQIQENLVTDWLVVSIHGEGES